VNPRCITIEDILDGVQKAVHSLPVGMAEEGRQGNLGIIKSSSKPRHNMRLEREALRNLKKNTDLTIIPAEKGNATVIINTVDYK